MALEHRDTVMLHQGAPLAHHLCDGEVSYGVHADGDIEHLGGEELAVLGPLHPRHLHQDADVPASKMATLCDQKYKGVSNLLGSINAR